MNTIFEFTDRTSVYSKCIFASICHAVMVGKYTLLSDEISWDGTSFLFQNMEGTRGVISFSEKNFLCGIQSEENYLEGENNIENTLLKDAELDIIYRVRGEIFPYLLVENDGDDIPAISAIFWGKEEKICSDMNEKEFMHKSDNILLPYLYEEKDMKKYWRDYYEMNQEHEQIVEELYLKKMTNDSFLLDAVQKEKLMEWFGEEITYCKQSLEEIGIMFD